MAGVYCVPRIRAPLHKRWEKICLGGLDAPAMQDTQAATATLAKIAR